jgi:hypothetical protein
MFSMLFESINNALGLNFLWNTFLLAVWMLNPVLRYEAISLAP